MYNKLHTVHDRILKSNKIYIINEYKVEYQIIMEFCGCSTSAEIFFRVNKITVKYLIIV